MRDSTALRRQLASALMVRGHLREAYHIYQTATKPDRWENPYDPYVPLALLGAVPAETAAAVFHRPLERDLPNGPAVLVRVLPWWFAQGDTLADVWRHADAELQPVTEEARSALRHLAEAERGSDGRSLPD